MKKMLRILLALVLAGALAGASVLCAVLVCEHTPVHPAPSDCIVVLGAHVWMDGRMSNVLTYRCQAALEVWRAGVAPFIIVCGGQGDKEPMPEAEAMAAWFIDQGVPAERVIADPDSINTLQNLQNARAIMEARGFKSCAVCTSGYHLRRALWLAKDVGLNATGIAAPSTRDAVSVVRGRLRETCSWILYFIRKLF